jgi:hypothetical protein
LNLAVVTDEFDDETFDKNVDTEAHVEEEEEEARISKSDEENVQSTMERTHLPMHRSTRLMNAMSQMT